MKISKPMLTCLAKIARGEVYKLGSYRPRGGSCDVYGGETMAKRAVAAGLANPAGVPGFGMRSYWTLSDAGREALRQAGMLDVKEAAE